MRVIRFIGLAALALFALPWIAFAGLASARWAGADLQSTKWVFMDLVVLSWSSAFALSLLAGAGMIAVKLRAWHG